MTGKFSTFYVIVIYLLLPVPLHTRCLDPETSTTVFFYYCTIAMNRSSEDNSTAQSVPVFIVPLPLITFTVNGNVVAGCALRLCFHGEFKLMTLLFCFSHGIAVPKCESETEERCPCHLFNYG
jgi:hypothetical protein